MKEYFGFECLFMNVSSGNRICKLLQYIRLFLHSIRTMHVHDSDIVWLQLPQVPLLWAAFAYKCLRRGKVRIVADCHNGLFRAPWVTFPFGISMLRKCDCVLIHNEEVLLTAGIASIPSDRLFVLEDVPAKTKEFCPLNNNLVYGRRPLIVFPASYGRDEPIAEIFTAARLSPEWTFVITGNTHDASGRHRLDDKPHNVVLTGFMPLSDFDALIADADIIVGLTYLEGVQLSVCNEALGFGKAMVLSDTRILRRLFSGAAVFVDCSNPNAIVEGIRSALERREQLELGSKSLCIQRMRQWERTQASKVKQFLNS